MQQNTIFSSKIYCLNILPLLLSLDPIKGSLGNFESSNSTFPVIVLRKVKLLMYVCTTSTVSLELKVDTELRLLYIRLQERRQKPNIPHLRQLIFPIVSWLNGLKFCEVSQNLNQTDAKSFSCQSWQKSFILKKNWQSTSL